MTRSRIGTTRFAVLVATALLFAAPSFAGEFRVGAAAVCITPSAGTPLAGYYHSRAASGVHDDLHSKALVVEKDGSRTALVVLDLITTPRSLVERARAEIEKATGIPGGHVMISATHAHTGPVVRAGSKRAADLGGETDLVAQYMHRLPGQIAESVRLAREKLAPARVYSAVGREDTLAFCRRFFMKDGTVGWNPGKRNPNIVKPVGPIDPGVPVVYCESTDRRPLATYVNYAMHLDTVGGQEISADYPYTLSRLLGEVKGPGMVTLFTIGAAGDINHINVKSSSRQKGHGEAARIGTILAAEVFKTLERASSVDSAALDVRVRAEMVKLPLAKITSEDVDSARRTLKPREGSKRPSFLQRVRAYKVLDVEARAGKPYEVEVQVVCLGNEIAWVSLPGEIFVELGLAIKAASPFPVTIVAELANGSIGYVPTRKAYDHGNYEPISARCAAGSGELLVETAVRLLEELHRS